MKFAAPGTFGAQLKALREAAGFTQEELATIAGLSVHGVSALERGERRRPQVETVRALSAALDLTGEVRDALLVSARSPARGAANERSAFSLPLAPTVLVGRESDLDTLREWLTDPAARLVTLTGPGGAGKTRLALEAARGIAAAGAARIVFVSLAAIHRAPLVAPAIAEALGLQDHTALDLPRRVQAACDGTPTVLLLDNCEQVLDAAPLIADLLTTVAALRVLATSRAPLRVRGEREYAVGPLALDAAAETRPPDDLARVPAVHLFLDRVRDVRPDFRLTAANSAVVTGICRRLDALPLALELAAPWLKVLTPDDLLRRLTDDALLTTAGPRDLPERQRTINATVAWSYQLLDPDEQRLFRRLGALPDRFPIEAAAAVLAGPDEKADSPSTVLAVTAALIDKSLLLRAETSAPARPLYRMLETVRAYAAHELAASGEREAALEGLSRYCVGQAALAAAGLVGPAQGEWLNRVRDDLESHRTALARLIDQGRAEDAGGIAFGLFFFWIIRGHAGEGLAWYERVLATAALPPDTECRALTGAGGMHFARGEHERGRAALNRGLANASRVEDTDWVPLAHMMLGHIEHASGNVATARAQFVLLLDESRRIDREWLIGNALSALAWLALATGDLDEADRLLEETVPVLPGGGPWFRLLPLYLRAFLAVRRQNGREAIALVRQSLVLIRELHDTFALVYSLVPLATAAIWQGDDTWAARILGARDAVAESTGAAVVDASLRDVRAQLETEARARLGPQQWARAYAAGRTISLDSLIRDIDTRLAN